LKRNTQLKKSETRIAKGKLFSLPAKKNGCLEVYQAASRRCMITILFSKEVVQD